VLMPLMRLDLQPGPSAGSAGQDSADQG
jgi:hypothetical protein